MEANQIPPKSEWRSLSIGQLYETKDAMMTRYYNMRSIHASFAPQYLNLVNELVALIQLREFEATQEREEEH